MMPRAGGPYVFLREAFGPLAGFLYGWTLGLVIQSGTIAAVATGFAKFTGVLIPWFSEDHVLLQASFLKITGARVLAVLGLIIVALTVGRNPTVIAANTSQAWNWSWTHLKGDVVDTVDRNLSGLMLLAALGVSMVGSLFSCDAWNNLTFAGGEVKNPQRTIPLSLILGTALVTTIFFLANVGYLCVLPLQGVAGGSTPLDRGLQFAPLNRVATAAASVTFGRIGEMVMAVLIMISTFGCNNGLILSGARVTYALARDRLFFAGVGRLNACAVPGTALKIQAVWASVLCLSGTYGDLLDYVIFAVLVFGILTVASVFVLRHRMGDVERPYRTWGYPVVPAFYVLGAAAFGARPNRACAAIQNWATGLRGSAD